MKRYLYRIPGWLLCCLLTLSSCIYDSVGDCGEGELCTVTFRFRYDYNKYDVDRFGEEVEHVSLFIYDAVSEDLKQRIDMLCTDMEEIQTISTLLPEGDYIAVTWANCGRDADYFAITQPGRLSTLQMGLTCIDEGNVATVNSIGSVFHAMNNFEAIEGEVAEVPMSMTKNTNRVRIIIRGLDQMTKEEAEEAMRIRVSSANWLYNHDNSVASTIPIDYRPEYNSKEEIVADFYILRMQTHYEDLSINLQYRDVGLGREPIVLMEKSLVPLLIDLENPPTPLPGVDISREDPYAWANELLDREDEYEIVFEVAINAEGKLYIESWDRITKPGELG